MTDIVQVTPIWKTTLTDLELRNVRESVSVGDASHTQFLAPRNLGVGFYRHLFPSVEIRRVADEDMRSIASYNRLVTRADFYRVYSDFDFLAIVQTDALLIRGLHCINVESLDYVGAPWNCGLQHVHFGRRLFVDDQCPRSLPSPKSIVMKLLGRRAWVGNGGLSVRRVDSFVNVTKRLESRIPKYLNQGLNEDVIFSSVGVDFGLRVASLEYAGSIFREHVTVAEAKALELVGVHAPAGEGGEDRRG